MNKPTRPSAAVSPRLLKEIRTIRTSLLSDALGKGGAMDHDMRCFSANCRMAGPAVTVRVHTADILMVGITLSHCPKGSVLVIDGQGELNTALWGEVTTLAARLKGLAGRGRLTVRFAISTKFGATNCRYSREPLFPTREAFNIRVSFKSPSNAAAPSCTPAIGLLETKMEWWSFRKTVWSR